MTAREALQAIVNQEIKDIRYAPVDLVRAIALLDGMEQRALEKRKQEEDLVAVQSLLEILDRSIAEMSDSADI